MSIQLQRNNGVTEEYFSYSEVLALQTELAILAAQNADCIRAIENNKQTILDLQNELARTETELDALLAECDAANVYIRITQSDAIAYAGKEIYERVEWGYKSQREAYWQAVQARQARAAREEQA